MHLLEGGPPGKSKKLDEEWDKLYRLALGLLYMQCEQDFSTRYSTYH